MFDYLTMLGAALLGLALAPLWVVPAAALLLTTLALPRIFRTCARHADLGSTRVFVLSAATNVLNNAVFAAMSYGLGRAVAQLLSA